MTPHVATSTSERGRCEEREWGGCASCEGVLLPQSEVNGGESGLEVSTGSQPSKLPSPDPLSEEEAIDGGGGASEPGSEVMSPAKFSFSAPMDNIVVRSYQFPIT